MLDRALVSDDLNDRSNLKALILTELKKGRGLGGAAGGGINGAPMEHLPDEGSKKTGGGGWGCARVPGFAVSVASHTSMRGKDDLTELACPAYLSHVAQSTVPYGAIYLVMWQKALCQVGPSPISSLLHIHCYLHTL